MQFRRVVVTGLGMLSPTGNSVKDSWTNILEGNSGVTNIGYFDTTKFDTHFAASLQNFNVEDYLEKKEIRRTDRFIQYALIAADQCIQDANIDFNLINPETSGVSIGSGIGGLGTIEETKLILAEKGPKKVSPFFVPGSISNMASGYVSL